MVKTKKDPRDRATFQLQLDITRTSDKRDENLALLDYLDGKKEKRKAKETFRESLALYADLERGKTKELLSQFPEVYQVLRDQIIRDLLGDMSAMNFSGKGRVRGKPEEDIDIEFEIKRDTTTDHNLNFLRSVMGATGNMLPIDTKPNTPQPKVLDVKPIEVPIYDDDDDLFN